MQAPAGRPPTAIDGALDAVRRRLRVAWAIATVAWVGPAIALGALALVGLGWLRPWAWPEPAAAVGAVAALVAIVVTSRVLRIPDLVAARAADRGLGTRDALAAALEVGDAPGPLADRVRERARTVADEHRAPEAVPLPRPGRRLALATATGLGAFALALGPNPQDDVRRDRAAEQAALAAEADDLRAAADALEARAGAGEAEQVMAERLRDLADELDAAGSLDAAQEALDTARADLAAAIPPDLLARRAAAQGLDRSLEATPLPGTSGGSAADQLAALAESVGTLSDADRAAVAERLSELAATQVVGNPAAADALDAAAAALAAGDVAGAQAALGEAAGAQVDSAAQVAAGDAAQAALAEVDAAAADAAARAAGGSQETASGEGQGQGQGEGSGSGSGSGGSGGAGSGGSGAGSGGSGGGGGGSPSGDVGAGGTQSGSGSGQGGQGSPSGGDGGGTDGSGGEETGAGDVLVYDPTYSDGEQLDAGGTGDGRPGETVGRANGASDAGQVRTPLSQIIADHQRRATEALARGEIPPSSAALVRAYFDALAGLGR